MADIERQRNFSIYPFRTLFFTCTRTSAAKNHQGSGEISWLLLFMYISTQILAWNYKSFQVSLYQRYQRVSCEGACEHAHVRCADACLHEKIHFEKSVRCASVWLIFGRVICRNAASSKMMGGHGSNMAGIICPLGPNMVN